MSLLPVYNTLGLAEAGVDEAGRGCLAGDVYAAAVILPDGYDNPLLNDSKQLSRPQRERLRSEIEHDALAWAVGTASVEEIDHINILRAAMLAMHRALDALHVRPQFIAVDGNKFVPYGDTPHATVVKGDGKYQDIAAASILAKTHRDEYMAALAAQHPHYGWERNAGYGTREHREALHRYGPTPLHRRSFNLLGDGQLSLF
ncbi:MAG: ribonuclease HII [Bacteroidaceae bacterium]|nr:ribonuclease HII [Bacteroidaceae bacterium]